MTEQPSKSKVANEHADQKKKRSVFSSLWVIPVLAFVIGVEFQVVVTLFEWGRDLVR